MKHNTPKTVAIIGAGPVGLAAAAHALERGLKPIVFESGPKVAHTVRQWGHVRMFSPWNYNTDSASEKLLADTGWSKPDPDHYPTGSELITDYLEPLAELTKLKDYIKTSSKITGISRAGYDKVKTKGRENAPFEVRYQNGSEQLTALVDSVIDTSGTWTNPNHAGANGLPAIGESDSSDRINYAMPDVMGKDRARFANKKIAVLGTGHSAIGTLIDLTKLSDQSPDTTIIWLVRGEIPRHVFGGGINDKLAARGELGATFKRLVDDGRLRIESNFRITHLSIMGENLKISSRTEANGTGETERHILVDELIVATGFRPDFSFVRELRLALDPALECPPELAPLIDPNEHSCGTVRPHGARELSQPETGFYIAGMKSYGRAPTFLTITGYEQVRSIIADIAGDKEAAERVELVLPETGVCSGGLDLETGESSGCCGGPALELADACCLKDEEIKAEGKEGCGCDCSSSDEDQKINPEEIPSEDQEIRVEYG